MDASYSLLRKERSSKVRGYGWKRQSPKLIFIIRPIAACWATACADADDETDRQDRSGCGRAGAEPDAQWQSSRDGIARASRSKIQERSKKRLQESYKQLLHSTGQVVAQAERIAQEVDNGVKKAKKRIDQVRLEALKAELLESDDSGHSTLARQNRGARFVAGSPPSHDDPTTSRVVTMTSLKNARHGAPAEAL